MTFVYKEHEIKKKYDTTAMPTVKNAVCFGWLLVGNMKIVIWLSGMKLCSRGWKYLRGLPPKPPPQYGKH